LQLTSGLQAGAGAAAAAAAAASILFRCSLPLHDAQVSLKAHWSTALLYCPPASLLAATSCCAAYLQNNAPVSRLFHEYLG
jgi:hypothetical protein